MEGREREMETKVRSKKGEGGRPWTVNIEITRGIEKLEGEKVVQERESEDEVATNCDWTRV